MKLHYYIAFALLRRIKTEANDVADVSKVCCKEMKYVLSKKIIKKKLLFHEQTAQFNILAAGRWWCPAPAPRPDSPCHRSLLTTLHRLRCSHRAFPRSSAAL